jgi:hypothetical protein
MYARETGLKTFIFSLETKYHPTMDFLVPTHFWGVVSTLPTHFPGVVYALPTHFSGQVSALGPDSIFLVFMVSSWLLECFLGYDFTL